MRECYCVYHSADLDGKMSAAIVRSKLPDALLVPWNYGEFAKRYGGGGHKGAAGCEMTISQFLDVTRRTT
jgi:nanoRNase/pAp phosphatase (c-di-AMP/oligoRNAs hydrolase)